MKATSVLCLPPDPVLLCPRLKPDFCFLVLRRNPRVVLRRRLRRHQVERQGDDDDDDDVVGGQEEAEGAPASEPDPELHHLQFHLHLVSGGFESLGFLVIVMGHSRPLFPFDFVFS